MKRLALLFFAFAFGLVSCNDAADNTSSVADSATLKTENTSTSTATELQSTSVAPDSLQTSVAGTDQETPRMKCLREANNALHSCMASAKTEAQKSACTKALQDAIALCPQN